MKKSIVFLSCIIVGLAPLVLKSQDYNNNAKLSYINHNVPKSPESSSFEKYGNIPVGEYTGTASVGINLFTIKGKAFDLPIELSYHASGIKVAQEATWVGLGWDLVPGGRITLQIKGGYDRNADQYYTGGPYATMAPYMVNYLKSQANGFTNQSSLAFGCSMSVGPPGTPNPADICSDWINLPNFTRQDLLSFLFLSSKHAALEPDIYSVNFLGKSLSFYKEPFTGKMVIKNENYNYKIKEIGSGGATDGWIIVDDNGLEYYFEQAEQTAYLTPIAGFYPQINTSWLLTRIVAPNGDSSTFTYANYGSEIIAPLISESKTSVYGGFMNDAGPSEQTNRNDVNGLFYQMPQHLVKITGKNVTVDFDLGYRDDIGGLGARKLEGIRITDRYTNQLIKQVKFNYEYFASTTAHPMYFNTALLNITGHGSSTVAERMSKRLKLNSVELFGKSSLPVEQRYRFVYNQTLLPNKVSLAQDHWGYFNDVNNVNISSTSVSFTPSLSSLVNEGLMTTPYPTGTDVSLSGNANRAASEPHAQAGMLTSVIYPTGGFTNFDYELHRSSLNMNPDFVGGGLRIKRISNFSGNAELESLVDYDYTTQLSGGTIGSGIYLGALDYTKGTVEYEFFDVENNWGGYGSNNEHGMHDRVTRTMFSNGNLNEDGGTVAYREVKKNFIDYTSSKKYHTVKKFHIRSPWSANAGGTGVFQPGQSIVPAFLYLAPTPDGYLAGKLAEETHFNETGQPVESVKHYYRQNLVKDEFGSIKVTDATMTKNGSQNRYTYVFEPIKSYFTTLDSIVSEKHFGNSIVKKKLSYQLNSSFQIEKTVENSSAGDERVTITKMPLSYSAFPTQPQLGGLTGNALSIQEMKNKNIINIPIEILSYRKKTDNSELVKEGSYLKYDNNGNVLEMYKLEVPTGLTLASFQLSALSTGGVPKDIVYDGRYFLEQSASYHNPSGLIKELNSKGRYSAFIYDVQSDDLLASIENASFNDIAYTSFETAEMGNWTAGGGSINHSVFRTGSKSYDISGGSLSKIVASPGMYAVSYWSTAGGITVNGSSVPSSSSNGGWGFYEHQVPLAANGTVTVSGSGILDELRLHPNEAVYKSTFTYNPSIGISSMTDSKSSSMFYNYDNFGRLSTIKDQDDNVLKSFLHNYKDNSLVAPTHLYSSSAKSGSFQRACPAGQTGSYEFYTVPAGRFFSLISQADADNKAQMAFETEGQANANIMGECGQVAERPTFSLSYNLPSGREFNLSVTDPVSSLTEYYLISGSGSLPSIPGSESGILSLWEVNYSGNYNYQLGSTSQSGNLVYFTSFALYNTIVLSVTEIP